MNNFEERHPLMFYGSIVFCIIVCSLVIWRNDIDKYEYIDENGDVGYSRKCIPNIPYSRCYTDDGDVIKVIRYHEFDK